jgi:hypothetical protein
MNIRRAAAVLISSALLAFAALPDAACSMQPTGSDLPSVPPGEIGTKDCDCRVCGCSWEPPPIDTCLTWECSGSPTSGYQCSQMWDPNVVPVGSICSNKFACVQEGECDTNGNCSTTYNPNLNQYYSCSAGPDLPNGDHCDVCKGQLNPAGGGWEYECCDFNNVACSIYPSESQVCNISYTHNP